MSRQAETSKYHLLKSVKIHLFRERLPHLSLNNARMLKVIMGNDRFALYYWRPRYFGVREVSSTNTCIHVFSFLLAKHGESQPSSAKLLLPIIPIGIVTCAFVLLWDNLCRNNCKQITSLSNTNAPVRFRAKQRASTVHYSSRSTVQNTILFCFA